MNKKAQVNVGAVILAIIGAIAAFFMARGFGASVFYKIIITILAAIVCYIIAWKILESG